MLKRLLMIVAREIQALINLVNHIPDPAAGEDIEDGIDVFPVQEDQLREEDDLRQVNMIGCLADLIERFPG